jgi:hypothetical protein
LRRSGEGETADPPLPDIKAVRRRTDQKIKQQEMKKQTPVDDPQKPKRSAKVRKYWLNNAP